MFSIIQIYIQKNRDELIEKPHLPGPHLLGRVQDLSNLTSVVTLFTAVIITVFMIPLLLKEPNSIALARVTNLIPTSGILIILGIISGLINHFAEEYFHNDFPPFVITADIFQHALIFPILLYASYKLYNQEFLRQFKSVIILALFSTFLNVLLSAVLLYFIHDSSWIPSMTLTQTIAFASAVSVVDPLAVAAVFNKKEISDEKGNFFLPFGAAVFGYGVAMELFKASNALAMFGQDDDIPVSSYLYVAASTITDPLLGIIIGVSCGLASASITRITSIKCEYFEPVVTLGCAFFGYVLCVGFGFSYIFATICCGLVQERYTFMNMSPKSSMNTENIIFAISLICELFVYILVGYLSIFVDFYEVWDFAIIAIVIIYIIRVVVTLGLSFLLNMFRLSTISFKWQLLIFGGHRGPMSLAMIVAYIGPYHKLFTETTLLVIVFSQLVDGMMSRYLATQLRVRTEGRRSDMGRMFLTSVYGGGELGDILGEDPVVNRNNWLLAIEKHVFRFFITDQDKLCNTYRIHAEELKKQFFRKLEKHNHKHVKKVKCDNIVSESSSN